MQARILTIPAILAAMLLAATVVPALAQYGTPEKESMDKKDGMKKEGMEKKDSMMKEPMEKKDSMEKPDSMKKDAMDKKDKMDKKM